MPKLKLTKAAIDALSADIKDVLYWDTEVSGLALKVTPKGRKSFLAQYRLGGRGTPTRKVKIGDYGPITLQKARTQAKFILGEVAGGQDPASKRRQERQKLGSDRVADLVKVFLEQHASNNRSYQHIKYVLEPNFVALFGNRSIHTINRQLINEMLDQVKRRGAHTLANRLLANVRKFFNWCISRGILESNPCIGIDRPVREISRDRVLTEQELEAVISATREMGYPYGSIVQAITLTAQRRGEVVGMRWDEIDIDAETWTIPASRSKNQKAHVVHLSRPMMELLEDCPKQGPLVFSVSGTGLFSGFSKAKRRLDTLSGVKDWRLHDLRRTFATQMAGMRIPPHIADKVLNHQSGTISGVAAVYQRHEFLDDRKRALDQWAKYIERLSLDGEDAPNVVPLRH